MDCQVNVRDGKSAIEFTWEGNDESDHAFCRGWVIVEGDQLNGMIFFQMGETSGFEAVKSPIANN
jgi:hypothetical protein